MVQFIENPILIMKRVLEYCEEMYAVGVDCCGEDDNANTIPAKNAMEDAKKVLNYLESRYDLK
jgi:hypothetical protein